MRCKECNSFWLNNESKFTDITEMVDIEAEDARDEPLKQHLKKLSQIAKKHFN